MGDPENAGRDLHWSVILIYIRGVLMSNTNVLVRCEPLVLQQTPQKVGNDRANSILLGCYLVVRKIFRYYSCRVIQICQCVWVHTWRM